ncbi:MAG TPA: DinB family protein [Terriglobales bacterium]|nr:DinB family protein [Terriglobales bacterium]
MKRPAKRSSLALVAVTLLAIAGTTLSSQGQSQNQVPRSRAEETLDMWNEIGNKIIAMAQDFPEDKYDFKLQKDERSFAENLLHVAALDYILIRRVSGANLGPDFGNDDNPSRDVYKTKADVVKLIQQAIADGANVIQQQGDAGLDKTSKLRGKQVHNSYTWMFAIEHSGEHYGQLVVYCRANNLVPPDSRRSQSQPAARVVDLKASDGTVLKASYFAAAKPGPGLLLLHQINRQRKAWDDLAGQMATAGINTLTLDMRGFGESGGTPPDQLTPEERAQARERRPGDIDTAFQHLVSQPGVMGDVIGVGGAGGFGVDSAVQTARRHSAQVKSLVLLSGETLLDGLQFLRQASQLPGLFVVADDDEYPPTQEAMELLYTFSSSSGKKFIRYAGDRAPWLGFEDVRGVPATGSHGTDMFKVHPELPSIIVDWFVTTLIKTPGQAPVDKTSAAELPFAPIVNQIEMPGGVARAAQQLTEARRKDPKAQLWPEALVTIMGYDHLRVGETKMAVEIMKLNVTAYPESADANDSLGDAYLADGEKDLARQCAEKALALLTSDTTDSEPRRKEIRDSAQQKLKQLNAGR